LLFTIIYYPSTTKSPLKIKAMCKFNIKLEIDSYYLSYLSNNLNIVLIVKNHDYTFY